MKMKGVLALCIVGLFIASCDKEDENENPNNQPPIYAVPTTYSFEDENGNSTVSFDGQTDRLNQLEEITTMMKLGNTQEML